MAEKLALLDGIPGSHTSSPRVALKRDILAARPTRQTKGSAPFTFDKTANPMIKQLDQFSFHHTLDETSGVSLVIFTSHGCGACRHWKKVLADYRQTQAGHALTLFEVDAQRDQALAREFEVFHLPALYLYKDGDFHCALQTEASPMHLDVAIRRALTQPPQESP